jgi:hypothetical protein
MEKLCKEVLYWIVLSTKAEKTAKGVSKMKGNEAPRAISAKDVEWQIRFEELAEQVAKLSKACQLDAESIVEVKTRIASCPSTALPVREKGAEATPRASPLSAPTGGHCVRDPSSSPLLENNDEEKGQSSPPRCRWHNVPDYSQDYRPELEVRKMPWHTCPSDSQIVLVKKKNQYPIDKLKVFSKKTTDNFWVWYKSVKTYFG